MKIDFLHKKLDELIEWQKEWAALIRAQKPSEPAVSFCPQCGFNVECDEDGCCVTCGATAMGEAVKALRVFSAQWRQAPTGADDE